MSSRAEPPVRACRWRSWFFGLIFAAALIGTVAHWGEVEAFARLVRQAQPGWLLVAIALQLSTYASVAKSWSQVLDRAGTPRNLSRLMRIAVAKLFADQALPSAGMGGNVILVDQLRAIGVARGTAAAALLISMIGYYAVYALFALLMLVLLWFHDRATPLMAGLVTLFLCVAVAIPSLALWLRRRASKPLPPFLRRLAFLRSIADSIAQTPGHLLRDRGLLIRVAAWNGMIFLADAATLFACLHALGTSASPATCFIALIMASIVMTLGPVPLGLGSFEATSTATLRLLGVSLEAAFAGTMLLRLLTLWAPLLPGMILLRGAARSKAAPASAKGRLPR
jgi:uncharacterized membrane protein YbhN (UPF0104 family)